MHIGKKKKWSVLGTIQSPTWMTQNTWEWGWVTREAERGKGGDNQYCQHQPIPPHPNTLSWLRGGASDWPTPLSPKKKIGPKWAGKCNKNSEASRRVSVYWMQRRRARKLKRPSWSTSYLHTHKQLIGDHFRGWQCQAFLQTRGANEVMDWAESRKPSIRFSNSKTIVMWQRMVRWSATTDASKQKGINKVFTSKVCTVLGKYGDIFGTTRMHSQAEPLVDRNGHQQDAEPSLKY